MPYSPSDQMLLIRALETRLQALCNSSELAADLHMNTGQEAIAVGVCAALRPTDYVVTHHRCIATAIAKGVPLELLVAELLGKDGGLNGGLSGEMALHHEPSRFLSSFQLVGTAVPVAAGVAWAVKNHRKTNDIVAVFFGDAATANGQWHEGVNLAAVQGLPLLLVCENNHLAGNVRPVDYLPVNYIAQRAAAYDIPAFTVDGNDLVQVRGMASKAVSYVRRESRPFLLECDTTRLGKHKQGQGDLRTKEEMAQLALRDPLRNVARNPDIERMVEAALEGAKGDR